MFWLLVTWTILSIESVKAGKKNSSQIFYLDPSNLIFESMKGQVEDNHISIVENRH